MLRGITVRQFEEWRAYANLEPFDEERADLRAASIVQAILSVNRKKGSSPIALKDCVLRFGTEPVRKNTPELMVEQRVEQIKATMRSLMLTHNKPAGDTARSRIRRNQ